MNREFHVSIHQILGEEALEWDWTLRTQITTYSFIFSTETKAWCSCCTRCCWTCKKIQKRIPAWSDPKSFAKTLQSRSKIIIAIKTLIWCPTRKKMEMVSVNGTPNGRCGSLSCTKIWFPNCKSSRRTIQMVTLWRGCWRFGTSLCHRFAMGNHWFRCTFLWWYLQLATDVLKGAGVRRIISYAAAFLSCGGGNQGHHVAWGQCRSSLAANDKEVPRSKHGRGIQRADW